MSGGRWQLHLCHRQHGSYALQMLPRQQARLFPAAALAQTALATASRASQVSLRGQRARPRCGAYRWLGRNGLRKLSSPV